MRKNKYNFFKIGDNSDRPKKKKQKSGESKDDKKKKETSVRMPAQEVKSIPETAQETHPIVEEEIFSPSPDVEQEIFIPQEQESEDVIAEELDTVRETHEVISFLLGKKEYAIDILHIIEIVIVDKINPLSNVEVYVEGLFSLRDEMIPVVNLEKKLGIEEDDNKHFGIVCILGEKKVCILTKKIIEVIYLDNVKVFDPPRLISGVNDYLHRIIKFNKDGKERVVSLINLHNLFSNEEKLELEKAIKSK